MQQGRDERPEDGTTERTTCRSVFAHWRCELPAGHDGLHEHHRGPDERRVDGHGGGDHDDTETTRWSSDLTGRQLSDLWQRGA